VVYRRQQSGTAWTPAPSQWGQLRAALGAMPTELTVYTAVFSNSQIASGNGPYTTSAPRRFQLAP
jgi:hypothetical protein